MDHLLTVKDIQKTLRLGHTRVYQLINSGELKTFKIGNRRLATVEALRAFIERQQKSTSAFYQPREDPFTEHKEAHQYPREGCVEIAIEKVPNSGDKA